MAGCVDASVDEVDHLVIHQSNRRPGETNLLTFDFLKQVSRAYQSTSIGNPVLCEHNKGDKSKTRKRSH